MSRLSQKGGQDIWHIELPKSHAPRAKGKMHFFLKKKREKVPQGSVSLAVEGFIILYSSYLQCSVKCILDQLFVLAFHVFSGIAHK